MIEIRNIELEEKTNQTVEFIWVDEKTKLPIDLTGYEAEMQFRMRFGDPSVLAEFTTGNGKIVLTEDEGLVTINFAPADTDQTSLYTSWSRAAYDLVLINGSVRTKVMKGFATISRTASL